MVKKKEVSNSTRYLAWKMKTDDASALTYISAPHLIKFVHHVIDNICGGVPVSHRNYDGCPLEKFWFAVQSVKDLARHVTVGKATKEEALLFLQPVAKETAEEIYDSIVSRKEEIKKSLLRESIADILHLQDFDWNVRLAIASDKILELNEALVTLHLHTSSGLESDISNISVEMSATQVDKLLEELKKAQQNLTHLQSQ